MKRLIITIIIACTTLGISAQTGLAVTDVFEGKIVKNISTATVTGEPIAKYGLTKMVTISFTANMAQRDEVEKLVNKDYENRNMRTEEVDREVRNGHVYYSIFRLKDISSFAIPQRYLCYQCKQKSQEYDMFDITMVYLEGEHLTLERLKKNFKRTK